MRERREEILPLARQFIVRTCAEHSCGPCSLSPEALDLMMVYDWPGNVRELENAIERAVLLAEGRPKIQPNDLPPEIRGLTTSRRSGSETIPTLAEVERRHVLATLEHHDGNRAKTAKTLGIGESTLWRKLKAYGSGRRSRRSRGLTRGVDR